MLAPEVVAGVAAGRALDMPDLFDRLRRDGRRTLAYPIREHWVDIGRIEDYLRASDEFFHTFLAATA